MKKALITNFHMIDYSGSELDSATIADYFCNNGYEVDIFTLKKGLPLLNVINPKARVITVSEKELLYKNYDIIWAHHYPLLDYLLFEMKIKSNYIIYLSLSAFEAYEALPTYCNILTLVGAITDEVKGKLIQEECIQEKIYLFPNYATKNFFDIDIKQNEKLQKVCIVSNHVPNELKELQKICKGNGIIVDIFGLQYTSKYINEDVLKEYDVIISIGKTIYYAMAMGIPQYCYDHFGGYGYINLDNVREAYKYHFCGRGVGEKKDASTILLELMNYYEKACKESKELKEFAKKNFSFEKNMADILQKIEKEGSIDFSKIEALYSKYDRKGRLFVERAFNYEQQITSYKAQVEKYRSQMEKYKNNYTMVINSTSWKITKGMRFIKRIISKVGKFIANSL